MFNIFKKKQNILSIINKKNYLVRFSFFLVATFIYALVYNMVLVPNNIVVGGMSGLAIVLKDMFDIPIQLFLYASMVVLLILAIFLLGKEKFFNTLVGSLSYTVMVSLTAPIAKLINFNVSSPLVMILITSILNGIAVGIIYRSGFNTGGADVISTIVNKYMKIPIGQCNAIVNTVIIFVGTILFGINKTIYAVMILIITSKLIDVVMLGINDSKMCYIKSTKSDDLKKYIMKNYKLGVTELDSRGGIFSRTKPTLLVIVPFDLYYAFKHNIQKKDPDAFVVSQDCYAVSGGYKKVLLPF